MEIRGIKMKLFLCIAVLLVTNRHSVGTELYAEYNILHDVFNDYMKYTTDEERISFTDGPDRETAFKFDNSSKVVAPINNTTLSNLKLSSPFILSVMFKFDVIDYSCLFAIKSLDNKVKLRLCVTPKAADIFEINLDSSSFKENINLDIYQDLSTEWVDLYIVFDKTKTVSLYIKCSFSGSTLEVLEKMQDIYFANDDWVYIGQSGMEKIDPFRGAIYKIMLYPNTDNVESVCKDEISLPDSFNFFDRLPKTEGIMEEMNSKGDKGEKGDVGARGERGEVGRKGETGEKGAPGASITGPPGPEGPIGPQGPIGKEGAKGEEGACKCSETVVSNLIKKMPEMKGPRGEPGPRGEDGDTGLTGKTGLPGNQGERGPKGLTGDKGDKGNDGIPGTNGRDGLKGEPGQEGPVGPPGPKGDIGSPGAPGLACERKDEPEKFPIPGDKGDVGPRGPPGPRGEKGEKGGRGDKGDRGLPGELGKTGPHGIQGEKGEVGTPGLNGEPGVPGTHGKPGVNGAKGVKGETGPPGKPAKLSSILDDDMDPVEKTMIVEILKGYKGEPGIKGDKGDKGQTGSDGTPGFDGRRGDRGEKGDTGTIGIKGNKGEKGGTGPPGVVSKSALSRMKGAKGDRGTAGKPGPRGHTGHNGAKGAVGPIGQTGAKGDIGAPGATGPKGTSGAMGIKGDKGERGEIPEINLEKLKGEKGERGELGPPGEIGKTGPPGLCQKTEDSVPVPGPPGPPGSPGPPGPPGSPGISVTGPKGEPGGIVSAKTLYSFSKYPVDAIDDDEAFDKMETLIYKTANGLKRRTRSTPVGTLAYVLEEKILLLRVEHGWQYVVMGSLFQERPPKSKVTPSHPSLKERRRKNFIRLAALDEPYSGNMETGTNRTGRKTVDQECHVQSRKAGFMGTFAALLANKVEDLKSILKTADKDVAVFNIHQQLLFDSWIDMFNESGLMAFKSDIYSFSGKNVLIDPTWPLKAAWHGGTSLGVRSPKYFCHEWQTDNPKYFGSATKLNDNKIATHEKYTCDKKLIVLCVEVRPNIVRRQRHISRRRNAYERLISNKF